MASNSLKAMLPSLQSTKVSRKPIPIAQKMKVNFFFCALLGMIGATHLYAAAFSSITHTATVSPQNAWLQPCYQCLLSNTNSSLTLVPYYHEYTLVPRLPAYTWSLYQVNRSGRPQPCYHSILNHQTREIIFFAFWILLDMSSMNFLLL